MEALLVLERYFPGAGGRPGGHCWAGLAGHKAGFMGPKGKAEDLLGLSTVSYPS